MSVPFPNPTNIYSLNIAQRSDGLHAFVSRGGLLLWKNAADFSSAPLPLVDQICHRQPSADFAGDKLVMSDVGGSGPLCIVELNVETMETSTPFFMGNAANRQPVVLGCSSGSCFVVSYTAEATNAFDIAYRSMFTNQWSSQRHTFTDPGSIPASNWTLARGTDGLLYVFGIYDGGQRLMLFRFAETPTGLEFVDEDTRFIHSYPDNGVYDPLAPMGELPWLHARTDKARGRVVIAYQQWAYTWECGRLQSKTNVVAIYPDKHKELVGVINEWSGHQNPAYLFPRPDGIYYALSVCRNCENFERFLFGGFLDKGPIVFPNVVPCDPWMAASADGWIVRKLLNPDWSETFELAKLPLPPNLTIKHIGASIEVSWDQQTPSDVLEGSTDQQTWVEYYQGQPPAIFSNQDAAFFRLKQTTS